MERITRDSTEAPNTLWPADQWLSSGCPQGGPLDQTVCEQAARELGRRTGLLPLVAPVALAGFFIATPGMAEFWLPVGALFSLLMFATIGRIRLARRFATAEKPDLLHLAGHYQNYVDATGLAWGCLIGLLLLVRGVDQVSELAIITSLAIFAGALTTLTLEANLWLRFSIALWLPLLVFTGAAAAQGMENGWILMTIEAVFSLVAVYQGRRMVREYVGGLLARNHLQQAMLEIAEQRDSLNENQTRLDDVLARMHRLSYYDQLTGIGSRHHFYERLEKAVRLCGNNDSGFALLHLDLDGFKDINDTFGHEAGDHLLQVVSHRISNMLHSTDFAARLGSDELAMLIHGPTDQAHLVQIAEQCLIEIRQPLELSGKRISPKASIGIAVYPQDGDNALQLLKASESAMHAAKHSSCHHFVRYQPQMSVEAEQRLTIAQELRQALDEQQFVLHYQPQVDADATRVCGVEALVRWEHPERGQISPLQFIPIAEQMGLIDEIGDWVLNQACVQAATWFAGGVVQFPIAVNISPLQLYSPGFVASVVGALHRSGLDPSLLELEITESALQTDTQISQTLNKLRRLGVRIAIDDFGTGYSSLGSLKELPIDRVKIDRLFVVDLLSSSRDTALLGTIVEMAHVLGCGVVAEGVEERGHVDKLRALGCDCMQGYYFSRPVEADRIPEIAADIGVVEAARANG